MNESRREEKGTSGGLLGASDLMERLRHVRKRKRTFEARGVDMEAVRQRVEAERRRKRGG